MGRRVRALQDLEIDEVSVVDKGANQLAPVVIAKSASGEEEKMDFYDADGTPVDPETLAEGDVVFDAEGQAWAYSEEEEDDDFEDELDDEPVLVGKADAFRQPVRKSRGGLADSVREELSKALSDTERDAIISKALGRMEEYEAVAKAAAMQAERERNIRLEREYTEIAKSYGLPIDDTQLGNALKSIAENNSYETCSVIAKALALASEASEMLFEEIGAQGGGSNSDVLTQVNAFASEAVQKNYTSGVSKEAFAAEFFMQNPQAYDDYLAGN